MPSLGSLCPPPQGAGPPHLLQMSLPLAPPSHSRGPAHTALPCPPSSGRRCLHGAGATKTPTTGLAPLLAMHGDQIRRGTGLLRGGPQAEGRPVQGQLGRAGAALPCTEACLPQELTQAALSQEDCGPGRPAQGWCTGGDPSPPPGWPRPVQQHKGASSGTPRPAAMDRPAFVFRLTLAPRGKTVAARRWASWSPPPWFPAKEEAEAEGTWEQRGLVAGQELDRPQTAAQGGCLPGGRGGRAPSAQERLVHEPKATLPTLGPPGNHGSRSQSSRPTHPGTVGTTQWSDPQGSSA